MRPKKNLEPKTACCGPANFFFFFFFFFLKKKKKKTGGGAVRAADAAAYAAYVQQTGIAGYHSTPGNRGAWALWRVEGDRAEIVTVSLWESRAGDRRLWLARTSSKAVFYPERRPVPDRPGPDRPSLRSCRAWPEERRRAGRGKTPVCLHNGVPYVCTVSQPELWTMARRETRCHCTSTGSCPPMATAATSSAAGTAWPTARPAAVRPASLSYLGQIARTPNSSASGGPHPDRRLVRGRVAGDRDAVRGHRAAQVPGRLPPRLTRPTLAAQMAATFQRYSGAASC